MPAVNAIEVAAIINGAGTSSRANVNGAFEFSITASVFSYWHDACWNAPRYRVDHPVDD